MAKPFSRPELLARIEAVLRRHRREADEPERRDQLSFDRVAIDVARREVRVDDEQIHLTTKEFDLLAHMAASPGRIFTRDQLLARIWGYDYVGDGRTVDVHVSWLRGKLRGPDGHNYFRTVRGVGYAFSPRTDVTDPTAAAAFEALLSAPRRRPAAPRRRRAADRRARARVRRRSPSDRSRRSPG